MLSIPVSHGLVTLWPRIKEDPSVCSVGSARTSASGPVVVGESASDWDAARSLVGSGRGIRVDAPRVWGQNYAVFRK